MPYSQETDKKWQKRWAETGLYDHDESSAREKLYLLEMFSYPSGRNLHVGHWWNYSLPDSWARMKRMQGFNVFHPFGFDAFGLPAENYAIQSGIHPMDSTRANIETMEQQFRTLGATYDWKYEIDTSSPSYYKWTQWLFLLLFKMGLAYRKDAPANWCPGCKTVLANEQVKNGECERCSSEVVQKNMTQWFFKITDYADELLDKLSVLDWPEKTKRIQTNWIGRSEGYSVKFPVKGSNKQIEVFTTRLETLMVVTFLLLAPEHPLTDEITTPDMAEDVRKYQAEAAKQNEIERQSAIKTRTGVFTGAFAKHPLTGEDIPVWIADHVVAGHGTGAVMVGPTRQKCDTDPPEAIISQLEQLGLGEHAVDFRMRDWLISRQRYWGAPIPIIYCDKCGEVPVPEKELPVLLPYDVEFMPTGDSPLAKCREFVETTCPKCGFPGRRETDTMDTFVCSSWYYLRFYDNKNDSKPFDSERVNRIMPVDKYVGGVEHAAMHLLYARFITKVLRDAGYVDFDEPFMSLVHQGTILADDGKKMSKSRPNAVSPDKYISLYGSDVFRVYLGSGFSYEDGGQWSDDGIKAVSRFIFRIEQIVLRYLDIKNQHDAYDGPLCAELEFARHHAIKNATADTEYFRFNTAIARIQELANALTKYQMTGVRSSKCEDGPVTDLLLLLAPFAPHFCEEMWEMLGNKYSIFDQKWPAFDEAALVRDMTEIAVMINGSVRERIVVRRNLNDDEVRNIVLTNEKIAQIICGRQVKRVVIVQDRLANIVV